MKIGDEIEDLGGALFLLARHRVNLRTIAGGKDDALADPIPEYVQGFGQLVL